jgi:hypothetical protein
LYAVPDRTGFYVDAGFNGFENFMEEKNIPFLEGCIPMFMSLV